MEAFDGHPKATYRGVPRLADVPGVLSQHDLLLLPTFTREKAIWGSL